MQVARSADEQLLLCEALLTKAELLLRTGDVSESLAILEDVAPTLPRRNASEGAPQGVETVSSRTPVRPGRW